MFFYLKMISIGILFSALIGIGQTVTGGHYFSGLSENGNHRYIGFLYETPYDSRNVQWLQGAPIFRAHGPSDSPNLFAALLDVGFIISLGFLLNARLWSWRFWQYLLAILVLLIALLFTLSRSGWAAAAIAGIVMVLLWSKLSWQALGRMFFMGLLFIGALWMLLIMLPSGVQDRIASIQRVQEVAEVQSRVEVWRIAIESIRSHPLFGVGTDRISSQLLYTWGPEPPDISPHNLFLAAAYQYGVLNLLLLMIFVGVIFWGGLVIFKDKRSKKVSVIGTIAVGFVILLCCQGSFDSLLLLPTMQIFFWFLTGTVVSLLFLRSALD